MCPQTPEEYQDTYRRGVQPGSEVSPLHAFAYDATWVAAKALTRTMEAVKHREKYRVRRNASVGEEEVQRLLLEAVRGTQLQGVTVRTHTANTQTHLKRGNVSIRLSYASRVQSRFATGRECHRSS